MNQAADRRLRAALAYAAEDVGDNPARYRQVADRLRRRRRRAAVAAAAAAAAGVLVSASMVALIAGPARTPQPEPARAPEPAQPVVIECPPPGTDPAHDAGPAGDGLLVPEGAVAVRVCGMHEPLPPQLPIQVTLDHGVDRLAAALNALAGVPRDPGCLQSRPGSARAAPPYDLVFAYPDGSRVTAVVWRYYCSVQVGDRVREDVPDSFYGPLSELVIELAEDQRWVDAPASPPPPECPGPTSAIGDLWVDEEPPRFDARLGARVQSVPYPAVAVAVCRYRSTDPDTAQLLTGTVVTGGGAGRARALVNAQVLEEFVACERPPGLIDILMFADAAGGHYEVRLGRGNCPRFFSAADIGSAPEPALLQWVDDALGGPPPD